MRYTLTRERQELLKKSVQSHKDYLVIFCVTSDAISGKEEKKADDCKSSAIGVKSSFTFYAAILKSNS